MKCSLGISNFLEEISSLTIRMDQSGNGEIGKILDILLKGSQQNLLTRLDAKCCPKTYSEDFALSNWKEEFSIY